MLNGVSRYREYRVTPSGATLEHWQNKRKWLGTCTFILLDFPLLDVPMNIKLCNIGI